MKNISLFIFVFILLNCKDTQDNSNANNLATTKEQQDTKLKRYQIESGIIHYNTTIAGKVIGSTITGSGTIYKVFKNFGAQELIEEKSSQTTVTIVLGNKTTNTTSTHTMNKLDNGDSYSVDFKNNKIYKKEDLVMQLSKQFNTNTGEAGKNIFKAIGGKKIGSETYKGYDCEIWENMGIKQWIHKGVTLKSIGTMMGITTTQEVENITFNTNVADSNFKLPNYPIVEQEKVFENVNFDAEMEDYQEDLNKVKKMSFEEWKKIATEDDEEMRAMSDKELRETYNMIQKMIKSRN